MKQNITKLKKLFVVLSTILIISATALTSSAYGFTTEYGTTLTSSSADFMSCSFNLPYIGGRRAYLYSNTGKPNKVDANNSIGETLPGNDGNYVKYDLLYSHIYDVRTMYYSNWNNQGINRTNHWITPEWTTSATPVDEILYGFKICIPFAVLGKNQVTGEMLNDDYSMVFSGPHHDLNTSDIRVTITTEYMYPRVVTSGGNANFRIVNYGTQTRTFTGGFEDWIDIFPISQKPSEIPNDKLYIAHNTQIEVSFTIRDNVGEQTSAMEEDFIFSYITPHNAPNLGQALQTFQISEPLNVQEISFDDFSFTDWVVTQLNSLLRIEIIWGVTIGSLMWFVIGISLFFFLMKVFLGG